MNINIIQADYAKPEHQQAIVDLLNHYACDPMGGGTPLLKEVQDNLVAELAKLPHAFSLIAYADNVPVGLANCFDSFSTFACKPIINIHDISVLSSCRGQGIAQRLLAGVENIARSTGCCKVTLEVLDHNEQAKNAYLKYGFELDEQDQPLEKTLFWRKPLISNQP